MMNDSLASRETSGPFLASRPSSMMAGHRMRWAWVLTAFASGLILTIGLLASYHAEVRNDQYQLIQLGKSLYQGDRLYIDCWENKPPGVAWLNWLGLVLAGGHPLGAWLLLWPAAALSLLGFALSARRLFDDAAAQIAVVTGSLVYGLRIYDTPSINPDFYASVFELAAISIWCLGACPTGSIGISQGRARAAMCAVCAGLLWLAATATKQVGFLGLFAMTVVLSPVILRSSSEASKARWGILWSWIGFLAGALVVCLVLAWQGVLGPAWEAIFLFNRSLLSPAPLLAELFGDSRRLMPDLEPLCLPLWLGTLGVIASVAARRSNNQSFLLTKTLFVWWVLSVVFVLLGPSRSMRYWLATYPPMLWLATAGISCLIALWRCVQGRHRLALMIVLTTITYSLGRPMYDAGLVGLANSVASYESHPNERDRLRSIGLAVQDLVLPGERIYVWAYHAGIYVFADRLPASRFVYPRSEQQGEEIVDALESGRARLILVPRQGSLDFERRLNAATIGRFRALLTQCEHMGYIEDYLLCRFHTPSPTEGSPPVAQE